MKRRGFITKTAATAIGAAAAAATVKAESSQRGAKAKASRSKRKVITGKAPKPAGPYSQAIVAGNTIYVAGQGAFDPMTGKLVEGGFDEQATRVFENIKAILEAAGASMNDVVKVTVYLAELGDFAAMNTIYRRYFSEDFPARATVGVKLLGGMQIEVECVAVVSKV